jgi:molybdopterin-guanine dinucleotide biosynthesis protein A
VLRISAAILAGGRARRFGGADKASLVVGGSRIVDRQIAAIARVADDIRIVTNVPERYAALGVRVIPDRIREAGPLGGLHAALMDAAHPAVLVLACDLPFVTAPLLEALIAEFEAGEKIDAVVPRSNRGLEPLCAVYAASCADAAKRRIDRGELAIRGLLEDIRVRELGSEVLARLDEGWTFLNVNSPHDYARATGRVELNEKPYKDRITE